MIQITPDYTTVSEWMDTFGTEISGQAPLSHYLEDKAVCCLLTTYEELIPPTEEEPSPAPLSSVVGWVCVDAVDLANLRDVMEGDKRWFHCYLIDLAEVTTGPIEVVK